MVESDFGCPAANQMLHMKAKMLAYVSVCVCVCICVYLYLYKWACVRVYL